MARRGGGVDDRGWDGWTTAMAVGAAVVPLGGLVVERRLPDDVPGGHAIDRAHRTSDAAEIDLAHRAAGTGGRDVAPARGEAGALSS